MNLILSGRGVDLDDRLREYATEKLTRVQKFFDRIIKMEVELRHERNPRVKDPDRVEIVVKTPGETLRVHGEGADHFAAIDVAADRLERRIKRFKNRLIQRAHRNGKLEEAASFAVNEEADGGPELVRLSQQVVKPLTPDEAILELDTRGLEFLMFTNAESMRAAVLYRRDDGFGLIEHGG
ncbi:MAG: ribosome-associated translation inhibitor RaiA [Actinomycetota bacterium]